MGPHLPLTKNPNCVYLSDCLLAGSGTDWLTVNLSSRCTAEGNRIFILLEENFSDVGGGACTKRSSSVVPYQPPTPSGGELFRGALRPPKPSPSALESLDLPPSAPPPPGPLAALFLFFLNKWGHPFRIVPEATHNCSQTQSQLLFETPVVGAMYEAQAIA